MYDFYTSDLHINHQNIITYCSRPFHNIKDQEEKLVRNFNSVVSPDNSTLFLGDMWFRKGHTLPGYMNKYNGTKVLLRGNHDSKWTDQQLLDIGFSEVIESHFTGEIDGHKVRFSHYPYAKATEDRRYEHLRPPKENYMERTLIHGHTHEPDRITKYNTIHVGVDAWNYFPVSKQQLVEAIVALKSQSGEPGGTPSAWGQRI